LRPVSPEVEAEREQLKALKDSKEFKQSARKRKKIEMLFAHLKRNLGLRRLRLHGLTGANDEVLLAATSQNLKKLVRQSIHGPHEKHSCLLMPMTP
jgi:hypothetical protein